MKDLLTEIERMLRSQDIRETNRLGQAVRDAKACMTSRKAGPCDCACCRTYVYLKNRGYDIGNVLRW